MVEAMQTQTMEQRESAAADGESTKIGEFERVTYRDCIAGKSPVPTDKTEKFIFQLFMVGGMVTIMTTFNGFFHAGASFVYTTHWMYPLVFSIAFLIRQLFVNALTGWLIAKFIQPHFEGVVKSVLVTIANVMCMAPLMSAIVTLLLQGTTGYVSSLLAVLAYAPFLACVVNYFVVGPAVKMIYANHMRTKSGVQVLSGIHQRSMHWLWIFGN